jgi:hypothetical protein
MTKADAIDKILHTTGYLPPRNEKEMELFEKEYSKVEVPKDFHIDIDKIIISNEKH